MFLTTFVKEWPQSSVSSQDVVDKNLFNNISQAVVQCYSTSNKDEISLDNSVNINLQGNNNLTNYCLFLTKEKRKMELRWVTLVSSKRKRMGKKLIWMTSYTCRQGHFLFTCSLAGGGGTVLMLYQLICEFKHIQDSLFLSSRKVLFTEGKKQIIDTKGITVKQ